MNYSPQEHQTKMEKGIFKSLLFFQKKEQDTKTASLKAEMVEATINQIVAELKAQQEKNAESIKHYNSVKAETNRIDLAFAEGTNTGLRISLMHLRRLYSDLLWKQLSLNLIEDEKDNL